MPEKDDKKKPSNEFEMHVLAPNRDETTHTPLESGCDGAAAAADTTQHEQDPPADDGAAADDIPETLEALVDQLLEENPFWINSFREQYDKYIARLIHHWTTGLNPIPSPSAGELQTLINAESEILSGEFATLKHHLERMTLYERHDFFRAQFHEHPEYQAVREIVYEQRKTLVQLMLENGVNQLFIAMYELGKEHNRRTGLQPIGDTPEEIAALEKAMSTWLDNVSIGDASNVLIEQLIAAGIPRETAEHEAQELLTEITKSHPEAETVVFLPTDSTGTAGNPSPRAMGVHRLFQEVERLQEEKGRKSTVSSTL